MERFWIFNAIQLAVSGYAFWRGGAPERVTGIALLIAAIATPLIHEPTNIIFKHVEFGAMTVDLILLVVMIAITLYADRFWPAWITALHALGTGSHLARAIDPDDIRLGYAFLSAAWSYPIMLLLVIGTYRHSRRVRSEGRDLNWSQQDPTVP